MSSYNPLLACFLGTHFIYLWVDQNFLGIYRTVCSSLVVTPLPDMRDHGKHRAVPTRVPAPLAPADHTHQRVQVTLLVGERSPTVALTTIKLN